MSSVFDRAPMMRQAQDPQLWDIVVVGGGATGAGVAVDAASRGLRVLLVEQHDFGKGTSSRSTKLIHGGVRYLQSGQLGLVRAAMSERGLLRTLAPHLVYDLPFVIPVYRVGAKAFYGAGLALYERLAGRCSIGPSQRLDQNAVIERLPTVRRKGLRGGVLYYDAAFDDARLLLNLVQTAVEHGATCLNYVAARGVIKEQGRITGVHLNDVEADAEFTVRARVVVNATGPFADQLRQQDDPAAQPVIAPSQGIHLVLDRSFLPGDCALVLPRTPDGRIMFAIPWQERVLIGTTDLACEWVPLEPRPTNQEIDFLLETAGRYLDREPTRADVLSAVAGIRPLVQSAAARGTAKLSRDHTLLCSRSGLLTITGGKWTTYRRMAQDAVDRAVAPSGLATGPCVTGSLPIHGHTSPGASADPSEYGSDAPEFDRLCQSDAALAERLHGRLPYVAGHVVWAARREMARTVDDVLSRRTRALWLDAQAASEAAPRVATLLARELGRDAHWQSEQIAAFQALAKDYLIAK